MEVETLRRQRSEAEERRIRAEDALRRVEHRNRLLGDSAPFGILTADVTGRITGWNSKIRQMLPWPADQDLMSVDLFEFKPLMAAGIVEAFQRCVEMQKPVISKCFRIASHGEGCHLRFYINPVMDEGGAVTGILAFLEDMTHQKLAEEAVRESGKDTACCSSIRHLPLSKGTLRSLRPTSSSCSDRASPTSGTTCRKTPQKRRIA